MGVKLMFDLKESTQTERVWEQGIEKNTWT